MSDKQPTTGQLRLIRDLHVDHKLAAISAERAAPALEQAGLLTAGQLEAAGIAANDDGQLLITRFSRRANREITWHVRDGLRLARDLTQAVDDPDQLQAAYARLADQLHIDFTPPTSYEAAHRQITRLKSILNEPDQAKRRDLKVLAEDIDLQQQLARSTERDGTYAPDTTENTPSTPEAEQPGAGASWGIGHQMAQQNAAARASAKQVDLLHGIAQMAGMEITPAETSRDISQQIDDLVASVTSQIHEIQGYLHVELTDTNEMKPWDLGRLLTDSKVAAMNELRTLEQMSGTREPAAPTSWAEAQEAIEQLRTDNNIAFSLRKDRQLSGPFHTTRETPTASTDLEQAGAPAAKPELGHTYAGIGSRRTPSPALTAMRATSERLSAIGYTMRSGHATGADSAFEVASQKSEIYLPWSTFENNRPVIGTYVQDHPTAAAMQLASRLHPAWKRLDRGPRALHARNMHQILGQDLQSPVDFVVCYTPDGSLTGHGPDTGGTATALRLAYRNNIPVLNIKRPEHAAELAAYLHGTVPDRRLQHCRDWVEHHLPPSQQQLAELLDLHVDERLSRLLPSQALAAITNTSLRDVADATTDFPFQYDEHGHQTGTGLDLIGWYAHQPGGEIARDAAYDQLAHHWNISISAPDTAELARMKIGQIREKLWSVSALTNTVDEDTAMGVGIG